jgi:hypothetical protein
LTAGDAFLFGACFPGLTNPNSKSRDWFRLIFFSLSSSYSLFRFWNIDWDVDKKRI